MNSLPPPSLDEVARALAPLQIPEMRRELSRHNVDWLIRNLEINNPDCGAALDLLKRLRKTFG